MAQNNKNKPLLKDKKQLKWAFLFFFTSAWMFVLGILVGRGIAPVKFDAKELLNELADLKKTLIKQEQNRYEPDTNKNNTEKKLDFFEELKKTDNLNNYRSKSDFSKPDKTRPLTKKRKVETKKSVQKKTVVKSVASKPSNFKSVATDIKDKYTIQVASFKDFESADKLVAKLRENGYLAYRSVYKVSGKGTWHRVRIGNFNKKSKAFEILGKLKKENISAIVVTK